MPNYQDAKIYKIVSYENDDVYVGSTTEPTLARRLSGHVRDYRRYLNGKCGYVTSFKGIESDNYDIQLIEAYPCNNKMELHAREGYWIKSMDCVNKYVAGRTHKESVKAYQKVYQKAKKEVIKKQKKAYYEENKEIILKHRKAYYKDNKETISAKRKKKEQCICGSKYTIRSKAQHTKSKKHLSYITSIDYLQDVHKYVQSIINKYK
jgi:hypothetical protein